MTSPTDRFWKYVDRHGPVPGFSPHLGPCWLWTGNTTSRDYGHFWNGERTVQAHRFSYALSGGVVPDHLDLDHLCRNHRCVNPMHLEPVTRRENLMRGDTVAAKNAAKTECINGHTFDAVNTYWRRQKGTVTRNCKECMRIQSREAKRKKRALAGV